MIGERLSEIRKDHGDTQADLAKKLVVSLPTVRSWEQERSSPSHEMLIAICKLYHVTSDYLLGLSDEDPFFTQRSPSAPFDQLTNEELGELHDYAEYLLWKKNRK